MERINANSEHRYDGREGPLETVQINTCPTSTVLPEVTIFSGLRELLIEDSIGRRYIFCGDITTIINHSEGKVFIGCRTPRGSTSEMMFADELAFMVTRDAFFEGVDISQGKISIDNQSSKQEIDYIRNSYND